MTYKRYQCGHVVIIRGYKYNTVRGAAIWARHASKWYCYAVRQEAIYPPKQDIRNGTFLKNMHERLSPRDGAPLLMQIALAPETVLRALDYYAEDLNLAWKQAVTKATDERRG